ncbi:hypothetical protein A4A49_17029 [Nicotiana attenuata]|uniref:Uncharacterized protein n=1 Tax=Nicotiana attenuata TaxID=49451 RepID=A0A314KHE4_NICAT|nr:hypothetical protein A4A49_17029 [Nicotiana attenuata]
MLYFANILTALCEKFKLGKASDELSKVIEDQLDDYCHVQDPNEKQLKKLDQRDRIETMEREIHQLRLELEARDRALWDSQDVRDRWLREQFVILFDAVHWVRHIRHAGVQTDFDTTLMSATEDTLTDEQTEDREEVVIEVAPTREGELIVAVDTSGVALQDPSTSSTEAHDRSSPPLE